MKIDSNAALNQQAGGPDYLQRPAATSTRDENLNRSDNSLSQTQWLNAEESLALGHSAHHRSMPNMTAPTQYLQKSPPHALKKTYTHKSFDDTISSKSNGQDSNPYSAKNTIAQLSILKRSDAAPPLTQGGY